MKRLICLSIFVFFSSIVLGQSGFNPPKINEPLTIESIGIDTVRIADSVRVWHEPLNVNQDTAINTVIREMRDSISRQNEILANQTTPTPTLTTPTYSGNRTTFTINTIPTPYNVVIPTNTREITIQNITGSDIQITTSQGEQILGARNNITLSNPLNTTINHAIFSGNVTVSFYNSVGGNVFGVAPRVIIDFKTY